MAQQESKKVSKGKLLIGLALFIGGCVATWFFSIKPIIKTLDARDWPAVPCKIISAELETHTDSDGTSYTFDINYQYIYNGKTYKSDKYAFIPQSKGNHESKLNIVNEYKQAQNPVCYVNPENPPEAVLKRGFHKSLLFAIFPPVLALIGLLVIGSQLAPPTPLPQTRKTEKDWLPNIKISARSYHPLEKTPITLQGSRIVPVLIGVLILNIVYNLIVLDVLFEVYQWIANGTFFKNASMTLLVPAISIFFVFTAVYLALALFNPRPIIQISSERIPLGSSALVGWSFRGRTSSIKHLTLTLLAKEWIRYSSGSGKSHRTTTQENPFYQMQLIDIDNPDEIRAGQAGIVIPENTMHSFEAVDNKIIWQIVIRGVVHFWPDIKNEFKIAVVPTGMSQEQK
jgi:hypothetical protein